MSKWLIQGGNVVDVERGVIERKDILIKEGKIARIEETIDLESLNASSGDKVEVIDARGKIVSPGLIDLHVHLRQPGFEYKETVRTGTLAAARGGFTAVACMPNTRPVIDSVETLQRLKEAIAREAAVRVLPIAAITKKELGRELTDLEALKQNGAVAFSDDGVGVQESSMMREAMRRARELDMPIVAHCEDDSLARGGVVHEGEFARRQGLKSIPSEAEAIHVARDILLAEGTGVHYHVCHISAEQSVHHVREGKKRGVRVTAEVTPHHLLLCDEDIPGLDPNFKMNPPLRSRKDREALLEGLKDGTIDIIATDHAPHAAEEKAKGMELAPFGIVGLETAFPLLYTHLVLKGELTLVELIRKMSYFPAKIFHLPWGRIEAGQAADITIIDLDKEKEIRPEEFLSKGRNTPFAGWKCKGWPVLTMVDGVIAWKEPEITPV